MSHGGVRAVVAVAEDSGSTGICREALCVVLLG